MRTAAAYIAASTNRFNHAAAWIGIEGLVAFAAGRTLALWDPRLEKTIATLAGHTAAVTCVRFGENGERMWSADESGVLKGWRRADHEKTWKVCVTTQAHSKSISALCIQGRCVVTGASDATVKIWEDAPGGNELREVQAIDIKGRYPLALALAHLPLNGGIEPSTVLAIATTSPTVSLYARPLAHAKFALGASLPGHEDWVRALSFQARPASLTLASGSQDGTIRLWKIEPLARTQSSGESSVDQPDARDMTTGGLSDTLLDAFEASLGKGEDGGRQITTRRHVMRVDEGEGSDSAHLYSATFDALLVGHDAGVTSLSWAPRPTPYSDTETEEQTLLSTSTDSSLILWSPVAVSAGDSTENETSLWVPRQRFGDVGGQRLGGFVGGIWLGPRSGSPDPHSSVQDAREVGAWGWSGGWRRWRCIDVETDKWEETTAIGGHAGPVKSVAWAPGGEWLVSASADQTTRIHAPLGNEAWAEIARPQVHGYDVAGAVFLGPLSLASAADEKTARVFEAPASFVRVVKGLGIAVLDDGEERAPAASVPPLGLSNKATTQEAEAQVASSEMSAPRRPYEGELAALTLWPETEKIFGHGYETISIAVSASCHLLATACRATTPEHAVVRVYDTRTGFRPFGAPLAGHGLSVTRIAFSPDKEDKWALTVSRDRSWRLFTKDEDQGYIPLAAGVKAHARIVWDCAWAAEGDVFATASRDKTVKVWAPATNDAGADYTQWKAAATIKTREAATAVAFHARDSTGRRLMAIGLETGEILIYSNPSNDASVWQDECTIDRSMAHVDHIHQLSWRPCSGSSSNQKQLASCSEDGTTKILIVHIDT